MPSPIPAGTALLEYGDQKPDIWAVDAHGNRLEKLVTAFAGETVERAQLDRDGQSIWYLEQKFGQLCGDLVHLDLVTNKRDVVTQAYDFALHGGRLAITRVPDGGNSTCQTGRATKAPLSIRDVVTGTEINWSPDAALQEKQQAIERGAGGSVLFEMPQWSSDGKTLLLSSCQGACIVKLTPAPQMPSSAYSLVPLVPGTTFDSMSWSTAGLYLSTGDQLCCDGPAAGQTVTIQRYDPVTLGAPTIVYHAKDEYLLDQVVSMASTLYVTARAYATGPGASGAPGAKVHLTNTRRLFTLGSDGRLARIGPTALSRGAFSTAQ